jgi:hypothetical protein
MPVPVTQEVTASVSALLWPPMHRPATMWACACPGGRLTSAVSTQGTRVPGIGLRGREEGQPEGKASAMRLTGCMLCLERLKGFEGK